MLATDNWCLKVAEKVYGPYTSAQMESFAAEGRLSANSLVAPAGGKIWRAARHYPSLNDILITGGAIPKRKKSFGKHTISSSAPLEEGAIANYIVIFDVISGAASRLEHILRNIGPAFRLTDNVWTVASDQTVISVKNTIAPHLQVREPVFVIDCNRGRSSWQNFVPETHSKLTKAWTT